MNKSDPDGRPCSGLPHTSSDLHGCCPPQTFSAVWVPLNPRLFQRHEQNITFLRPLHSIGLSLTKIPPFLSGLSIRCGSVVRNIERATINIVRLSRFPLYSTWSRSPYSTTRMSWKFTHWPAHRRLWAEDPFVSVASGLWRPISPQEGGHRWLATATMSWYKSWTAPA